MYRVNNKKVDAENRTINKMHTQKENQGWILARRAHQKSVSGSNRHRICTIYAFSSATTCMKMSDFPLLSEKFGLLHVLLHAYRRFKMLFVIVAALAALQFSTVDASCAAGYYPANSTACLACPAGFACVSNQAPVACLAGFYSAGYAQVCSPCATGTYANSTASRTCISCPSGYACLDSASAPALCPAGSVATAGSAVCTVCSQGTYTLSAGASVCQACPIGYACSSPSQSPVACSTGYYSRANASQVRLKSISGVLNS
jgi:hypothetical protein